MGGNEGKGGLGDIEGNGNEGGGGEWDCFGNRATV